MALQETKCPNCGANIVADTFQKKVTCIYCHTSFELSADETGNSDNSQENDILERAETFLTLLKKQEEALELFNEYSMLEPADYRGWWGIARAYSSDFTDVSCDEETYALIEENVNLALRVAGDKAKELGKIWDEYKGSLSVVEVAEVTTASAMNRGNVSFEIFEKYNSIVKEFKMRQAELDEKVKKYKAPSTGQKVAWAGLTVFYGAGLIPIYLDQKKKKEIDKLNEKIEALGKEKAYLEKVYGLSEDMLI